MRRKRAARAAWSLPGLCAAAAVWSLTTGILASLTASATAGLAESRRAASLCLAAAALEAAVGEAVAVLAPAPGQRGDLLKLRRADGGVDCYRVSGRVLADHEAVPGPAQILSRDLDFVVFYVRAGRPWAVRYFLGCGERCLLSSSAVGGAR